jgi:hypothetical protein
MTTTNLLDDKADSIPEKFLDKDTNTVRVDALVKSYRELEKKLAAQGAQIADPAQMDRTKILGFLGVPESADDYKITISHDMFTEDDEINKKLFERGFTREQAQFVYDLAADYMVPLVLDIASEFQAERQLERLQAAFGGAERYAEVAKQLLAYGRKNLSPDVLGGLSSSFEGIMALYKMMQSGKPLAVQSADMPGIDEGALRGMMKDPKYWRDKDPAFVKKVSDGFRQVFTDRD